MHGGEEQVVAQIVEMRDAALLRAKVAHRRWQIDRRNSTPAQADRGLSIKIEAPHPACSLEDLEERRDRIDAEAEQRITDPRPQRLEIGPAVRDLPSDDAQARR